MTDRYFALTVALDTNIRSDDAEALIAAIRQLRGVLAVEPLVASPTEWVAEERARAEIRTKLIEVVFPKKP